MAGSLNHCLNCKPPIDQDYQFFTQSIKLLRFEDLSVTETSVLMKKIITGTTLLLNAEYIPVGFFLISTILFTLKEMAYFNSL